MLRRLCSPKFVGLCVWALVGAGGCATRATPAPAPATPGAVAPPGAQEEDPAALLARAEEALEQGKYARASALFSRYLSLAPDVRGEASTGQAYLGLAAAHEARRDCEAAVAALRTYTERFPSAGDRPAAWARQGACHAELGQWEASARSYARALEAPELLPSARVEALARRGYALFNLDRFEDADRALADADAVFARAQQEATERFSTFYFVGMARFYRAAIVHRRFRDAPIRLPKEQMAQDYEAKLKLLVQAQEAYNHTIRAKHMFWVSASGFWLGSLFAEFHDSMMYAPVPDWLTDKQRKVYYEELKKQLGPVIDKAVWVLEKNLETARRLGYESPFIEDTEARLSDLQGMMLAGDTRWGKPTPRLAPAAAQPLEPPEDSRDTERLPVAERKLFVPLPTTL